MKVLSKDVYAILRQGLAEDLKKLGFKRLKVGRLGWTRPFGERHLTFWFECNKWGWFDICGSDFSLNFQVAKTPDGAPSTIDDTSSFCRLLKIEDREVIRSINNTVIETILANKTPDEAQFIAQLGCKVQMTPYRFIDLIDLHYFTHNDVITWTDFIKSRLTKMLETFTERIGHKLPRPVERCSVCEKTSHQITGAKCQDSSCAGTMKSAVPYNYWSTCPNCDKTGIDAGKCCQQCGGAGYLYTHTSQT